MLTRYRGDTQSMTWDLTINNVAVDITDAQSIQFTYLKNGLIVTIDGDIIGLGTDGRVKFIPTLTTFDTVLKTTFDIQVVFSDGTKRTFIKDNIEILDDVNKS